MKKGKENRYNKGPNLEVSRVFLHRKAALCFAVLGSAVPPRALLEIRKGALQRTKLLRELRFGCPYVPICQHPL
jgi:hypothetical protein